MANQKNTGNDSSSRYSMFSDQPPRAPGGPVPAGPVAGGARVVPAAPAPANDLKLRGITGRVFNK